MRTKILLAGLILSGAAAANAQFNSGSDRFPVPGSRYVETNSTVYTNESTLTGLILSSFSTSIVPPTVGNTSVAAFNATFDFTWTPLVGPPQHPTGGAAVTAGLTGLTNVGGVRTFSMELLQLNMP